MAGSERGKATVSWKTCLTPGCEGEQLPDGNACWAHAEPNHLDAGLRSLSDNGVLNACGVDFTADLWQRVLDAAPNDQGRRLHVVNLDGAHLPALIIGSVQCDGEARFFATTFDDVLFVDVAFGTPPAAGDAENPSLMVNFRQAEVLGTMTFDDVAFHGGASFDDARFGGRVELATVEVARGLYFRDAHLDDALVIGELRPAGAVDLVFQRAVFAGAVEMCGVDTEGTVDLLDARFETARDLGPLRAGERIVLDGSVWVERALIEVSTAYLSCRRARFLAGAELRIQARGDAEVFLDEADLAGPSVVTRAERFAELEGHATATWPRILSLRGANVMGLTLAGVDLRGCRFAGAHHLDQLRLDDVRFSRAPGWGRTRRRVIADEVRWRVEHSSRPDDWASVAAWPDDHPPELLAAEQVAAVYRDLRKGREDNRDEPGATDFYYGEMEMRRAAATTRGERIVLTLYWLLSGYGMRAWRSLTALAAVIAVTGSAFAACGLEEQSERHLSTGLLVAAQTATAIFAPSDVALTVFGAWLHLSLRVVGPALLGLTALAVRGRVKR